MTTKMRIASADSSFPWRLAVIFFSLLGMAGGSAQAIVGATTPAPELGAYVVMILKRDGNTSGFCSASVLAQDVVLTAAHCIAEPANTRVYFHDEQGKPVMAEIAATAKHPGYRPDAVQSRLPSIDLALLHLATPLPAGFKPVTLAEADKIPIGQNLRIAGFGVGEEGIAASSGRLRAGRIAVRAPLSSILLWTADPKSQGTGACTGDSGGPILALDQPVLIAVIDWAEGSGKQKCGALTQAALVAPQRDWIARVLASWRTTP